jgi:hypothetical protein
MTTRIYGSEKKLQNALFNFTIDFGDYAGLSMLDMLENATYMRDLTTTFNVSTNVQNNTGKKQIATNVKVVSHLIKAIIKSKFQTMVNKMNKITLGDMVFGSKKQLGEFVSTWLRHSYDGYKINMENDPWILDLLQMHPFASTKLIGMVGLHVRYREPWYCFVIDKNDGSTEEISYIKCMNGESKNQLVLAAMRNTIRDQTAKFKKDLFKKCATILCPISGIKLLDNANTHIDHNYEVLTFKQLTINFCNEFGYTLETIPASCEKTVAYITDDIITGRFATYHKQHAALRAIHKSANLSHKFTTKSNDVLEIEQCN